ncbi:hypothetical protein [Vibrio sp. Hep-1b-8]|uniref:hypothetical protein n=1 Tax=Vibrio sp. Hep-1b-8 TaxID=2144187 RepID=UPI0011104ACD|nr:hypothetical protein [Vibrio sp. Hep-1b-8]TMX36340.1 hypothetical protein DA100_12865 [Vibrio sp. Hep-1b-8]
MNSKQDIESLKEQLYNAEVTYSWECKGAGLKHENLVNWLIPMFVGCLLFGFFWFVFDKLTMDSIAFWGLLAFMTMMVLVSRYLFSPDKHRCYHLTSRGIHYTEQDMIPEVAYKIVRGFAWVGIVVCVIAVLLLGPLALVGAGAFALMSFGMTNFQPTVLKHEIFFSDSPILFNVVKDTMFRIDSHTATEYCCRRDFYCSSIEEKQKIITLILESQKDIEYVELAKLNDMFKHPIFTQD